MDSARPSLPHLTRRMSAATYAAPAAVASATAGRAARRARVGAKVGSPRRRSGTFSHGCFLISGAAHFGGPADPWRRAGCAARRVRERLARAGARIRAANLHSRERATPERVPRASPARASSRAVGGWTTLPTTSRRIKSALTQASPTPSLLPGVARHPQIRDHRRAQRASLPGYGAPRPPSPPLARAPPRPTARRTQCPVTVASKPSDRHATKKTSPNQPPDADRNFGRDRDRDRDRHLTPRFLVFPLSVWRGPFVPHRDGAHRAADAGARVSATRG